MARHTPTPSQTVGPFFPAHFISPGDNDLTRVDNPARRAQGERIYIGGRIFEARRIPRWNCIVEVWQADANGCFAHPNDPRNAEADADFMGWGRRASDDDGWYDFITVKPGGYLDPLTGKRRAPHINVAVMGSGLMRRLVTSFFFPDEPDNADDPVFAAITDADARARLVLKPAQLERAPAGARSYTLDLVLQGEEETPFFLD